MPTPGLNFTSKVSANVDDGDGQRTLTVVPETTITVGGSTDIVNLPAVVASTAPVGKVIDWVGTVRP